MMEMFKVRSAETQEVPSPTVPERCGEDILISEIERHKEATKENLPSEKITNKPSNKSGKVK